MKYFGAIQKISNLFDFIMKQIIKQLLRIVELRIAMTTMLKIDK